MDNVHQTGHNFMVPMWLPFNAPLPDPMCDRLNTGCRAEYIFCDRCHEKILRITHKALYTLSAEMIAIAGLSHTSGYVEYIHECAVNGG
jgi:hypothetical protein